MAGFEQLALAAAAGEATAASAASAALGGAASGAGGAQTLQALQMLGTGLSAGGTILTGVQARAASRAQAREYERIAGEERAAAGQRAAEKRRRMNLLLSRSQAVAADSGAGATDPTVLVNEGNIFQEGEYQAAGEKYIGESRARGLETRADVSRTEGDVALGSSILGGAGTILSGVSSYYDKYGRRTNTSGLRYG